MNQKIQQILKGVPLVLLLLVLILLVVHLQHQYQEQIRGIKNMENTTTEQPNINPTALALSRAIRQKEGGDYNNTDGDAGTSAGAYQWNNGKIPLKKGEIPANFRSAALRYKLNPDDFSPQNQDHVAYEEISKDLESGLTQSQIAAKWNSGLTHGWENHKGTTVINGKKVSYDTPAYVKEVQKYYEEQVKGAGTPDVPGTPHAKASTGNSSGRKSFQEEIGNIPASPTQEQHSGTLGTNPNDSLYGKLIDNSITRGITNVGNALSFGGAKQLGGQLGTGFAAVPAAAKDLFTGSNDSQYHDQMSLGNTTKGLAKTVGSVGLFAGGGLLGDLMKAKSALQAPEVVNALENTLGKGETIASLTRQDAINALGNTLKEMPTSEVGGKAEQAILKALKELNPTLIEKKSLFARLAKGGWNLAKGTALAKLFGDTVGNLIHQNTK